MTLLETYLPVFQFREFHQVSVEAAPADLLDAVNLPGVLDDPWVKRIIKLRETPGRLLSALGRRSLLRDKAVLDLPILRDSVEIRTGKSRLGHY